MEKYVHQKKLSNIELAAFAEQMSMILRSGISTTEGLSIMIEDSENDAERTLLGIISEEMNQSGRFHTSLKVSEVFPAYMLQMVQIGEETGRLDEVMTSLATHYAREEGLAQSMKSALTYPLIMIGMMFLVILVLITKVMPIFNEVFKQLGREMTGISGSILALGSVLSRYGVVLIGLLIVFALLLVYFTKSANGRRYFVKFGYHFRFSRNLFDKMAACRFADGMSLTLKSGMTPDQGLEYVKGLVDNPHFIEKIVSCENLLHEGKDFSEALQETKIFTGLYSRMASLGAKSGKMDEVLGKISTQYEEEVDTSLSSFISILEPTLVIILSIVVGMILFSVMLPLLGIMAGL